MSTDPAALRTQATEDAHRLIRQARAAVAAAAAGEPSQDRRERLSALHAQLADAEGDAFRLRR